MKLGLFGINMGAGAHPGVIAEVARAAEDAGFESLWAGEHVVLPDPQAPPSPMAPQDAVLDPLIALTWAAAVTTNIRLATGIIILPQRNPVVLAKQVASLDVLSGGRFLLGVGVGYLESEFRAIGADFPQRGPVTDDFLAAMTELWHSDHPAHHGKFSSFEGIDAYPRPVQSQLPIVVGGHTRSAFRRAVTKGTGWYGFMQTPEQAAAAVTQLRRITEETPRPVALGELEISITPRGQLSAQRVEEFAAAGVGRLIPMPRTFAASRDDILATIDTAADAVAGL